MNVSNLKVSYNSTEILSDINFVLNDSDKVCLVGPNGAGKSTLLKALSKNISITSGTVNTFDKTIGYLKQEIPTEFYDYSIINYIKLETGIDKLETRLHELENNLNDENMNEYSDVLNEFLYKDGYNFSSNLENILSGLNVNESLNTKISELSGGQKIKVLLASLLLSNFDILLLDEPTNNIDIDAIVWLENYLKKINSSIILVSHDEEFINNIANKIFELNNGILKEYNFSYYKYLEEKELEYKKEQSEYESAIQEKERLKSQLQKAKEWANKGNNKKAHSDNDKIANNFAKERTNNSNISKLTKSIQEIYIPKFEQKKPINFFFSLDDEKGNKKISMNNLVCGYENFKTPPINLNVDFGTKMEISGPNGSGKTTLIKTIIGELPPIDGEIIVGSDAKIGYISQDTLFSEKNETVLDYIKSEVDDINLSFVFTLLDKFNIKYEDKDKLYSTLSPGQRTRVNLAKIALNKINILILDEVTNHLDKEALELIYELITSYQGTIISISHNRKFNELLNADLTLDIETGLTEVKSYTITKK